MEESRLTFIGKVVDVLQRISRLFEQVLQVAPQHKGSLCFLARVAPGVHGAYELDTMGSTKVLLENNCVSNHEREAQGILEGCEPVIIDAAHLVDLRFDSRVCMLPRQHLDLVPCKASGWEVQREWNVHEVAISSPGNCFIASIHTLGFHSRMSRAEH